MSQKIWNSFACNLSLSIYSISVFWSKTTIYHPTDWKKPVQGYQYFHHISRYNFGSFLRKVRCCPFLSFSTLYYRENYAILPITPEQKVKTKNLKISLQWKHRWDLKICLHFRQLLVKFLAIWILDFDSLVNFCQEFPGWQNFLDCMRSPWNTLITFWWKW